MVYALSPWLERQLTIASHGIGCPGCAVRSNPNHDAKGRFSSGSGVRSSLANAGSTGEIAAAASDEARAITGRHVAFDFEGSDPEIARQHAEGVLRGLERFPAAPLSRVGMFTPEAGSLHESEYAHAGNDRMHESPVFNHAIEFSTVYAGNPTYYRNSLRMSENTGHHGKGGSDPMRVALHEFGHVAADSRGGQVRAMYDRAVTHSEAAGSTPAAYIASHLSKYGATSMQEFSAEAFADVMYNGDAAAGVSRAAFEVLAAGYGG